MHSPRFLSPSKNSVSFSRLTLSRLLLAMACACAHISPAHPADLLKPATWETALSSVAFAASRFRDPDIRFHRQSDNYSKPIEEATEAEANAVTLEIYPDSPIPFAEEYIGLEVRILNRRTQSLGSPALNGAIDLVQEAEVSEGLWKPIETLPESCCGLGRTRLFLEPNHFWTFSLPKYSGAIPARLRFRFTDLNGEEWVSPSYPGGYNANQLQPPDEALSETIVEAAFR